MYNKLEALRVKGDAEKMMVSKDYVGAREKLLKAQQLFPALDHIIAMLTVCDILSAARNRIPGYETDYYWVLNIMPSSSCADVKRQYDKLFNLLEPIKGKFSGTELALKYMLEAFSVLSDRSKRLIFDSKRSACWADYELVSAHSPFNHGMSAKDTGCTALIPSIHDKVLSDQFWDPNTAEGLSVHLQQERIEDCGSKLRANYVKQDADISPQESSVISSDIYSEGNMAEGIDMSVDNLNSSLRPHITDLKSNSSWSSKALELQKLDQDFFNFGDNRTVECFKIGQIWAVHYHLEEAQNYRYAQIDTISKSAVGIRWLKPIPVSISERRWCDAGLPVGCGSFCLDLDMSEHVSSPMAFSYKCSCSPGVTKEQLEIYPKKGEIWALYEDWDVDEWSYNPKNVGGCKFKLVEILSDFSRYLGVEGACLSKVDSLKSVFKRETKEGNPVILRISSSNLYMLSHNVPAYKFTGGEIDGVVCGMFELDQLALLDNKIQDIDCQMMPKEVNIETSDSTSPLISLTPLMPNADCTILGSKWSVNDLVTGQVWAVYNGQDLMPRRYVRIDNIITGSEVCVTLLDPQPVFDYDVNWKKENLPIVCGVFQAKETTVNINISLFSHLVKCQMSTTRPLYKIYPTKGEVWAMYQNWKSGWKRPNYENSHCWIFEVLSDFSEDERMMVARLGEVKGCLTFFQRMQRDGFDMSRAVSKTEVLSFSHQIPTFRVPGIGRYGIPENSWHLEPNCLPPHHRK